MKGRHVKGSMIRPGHLVTLSVGCTLARVDGGYDRPYLNLTTRYITLALVIAVDLTRSGDWVKLTLMVDDGVLASKTFDAHAKMKQVRVLL